MRLSVALLCHALAARQALAISMPIPHLVRTVEVKPAASNDSLEANPPSTQDTTSKNQTDKTANTKVQTWAQGTKWPYKYIDALPLNASLAARKFQPLVDFDDYTCYNMPAIDRYGELNEGFRYYFVENVEHCRQSWGLEPKKSNVYVRRRCNNGWCAWVYAYYFPMDQVYGPLAEWHGQRHEWDHVVVWTRHPIFETDEGYLRDDDVETPDLEDFSPHQKVEGKLAAFLNSTDHRLEDYETRYIVTRFGQYQVRKECRIFDQHPKVIYGWKGPGKLKHSFRPAIAVDTQAQNELKRYILGGLVEWENIPRLLRQKLGEHDWGRARMRLVDDGFNAVLNDWVTDDISKVFDPTRDTYPHIAHSETAGKI